jgi:hypothetical protein
MNLDLFALTWQQFAIITLAVTLVRFLIAVVSAIRPPNAFDWLSVATVLDTQVLKRVVPIAAIAFLAQTFPAGASQTFVWGLATAGLALYVSETVKQAATNWANSTSLVETPQAVAAKAIDALKTI